VPSPPGCAKLNKPSLTGSVRIANTMGNLIASSAQRLRANPNSVEQNWQQSPHAFDRPKKDRDIGGVKKDDDDG
jgi:hypothetical protein